MRIDLGNKQFDAIMNSKIRPVAMDLVSLVKIKIVLELIWIGVV